MNVRKVRDAVRGSLEKKEAAYGSKRKKKRRCYVMPPTSDNIRPSDRHLCTLYPAEGGVLPSDSRFFRNVNRNGGAKPQKATTER